MAHGDFKQRVLKSGRISLFVRPMVTKQRVLKSGRTSLFVRPMVTQTKGFKVWEDIPFCEAHGD